MTEKRFKQVLGGIKDTKSNRLLKTPMGLMLQYADVFSNCIEWLNELQEENEKLKKKILEEIDLEVAYVNETYSDGRMSEEQNNGAIISLRQLREKFE